MELGTDPLQQGLDLGLRETGGQTSHGLNKVESLNSLIGGIAGGKQLEKRSWVVADGLVGGAWV